MSTRPMMLDVETTAICREARRQLEELEPIRRRLLPDRDDPWVLSELAVVESRLAHARRALDDLDSRRTQ